MKENIFILPNNKYLYIRPEALEKMTRYKQIRNCDTEAGGILIGRILIEDENFIIDDVSEPMPTDVRKRTRFSRKPTGHQEYFNSVWEREVGRTFYLGEWHTHPQKIPVPSKVDQKDWLRLLKKGFESKCLFFIIVGLNEYRVWYGSEEFSFLELKRRDVFEQEG